VGGITWYIPPFNRFKRRSPVRGRGSCRSHSALGRWVPFPTAFCRKVGLSREAAPCASGPGLPGMKKLVPPAPSHACTRFTSLSAPASGSERGFPGERASWDRPSGRGTGILESCFDRSILRSYMVSVHCDKDTHPSPSPLHTYIPPPSTIYPNPTSKMHPLPPSPPSSFLLNVLLR
jgi:hypothetical protein